MNLKNKKILVTGGAGFIGSHIVDELIKKKAKVIIIDNLSTGRKENINKRAKFYKGDIRDLNFIKRVIEKEKPEIIYHQAAIAEVIKSVKNPIPTLETNVLGTVNLLLVGGENGIKKFIFASSGGAIYGKVDKIPVDEKNPTNPLSPYGLSKLLAEECIKFYAKNFNFQYLILRYPNVYGPRQNPKGEAGVVAIFTGLIKEGKRPIIFGDGTKTRDYVYVDDIVRANILGLSYSKNEILNLGWGRETSDYKIFEIIAKNLNFKEQPIYAPFRQGEVYRIALNSNRAKKVLNWQPKISLEEGIKKTIKFI